jgi:hypothetical protein
MKVASSVKTDQRQVEANEISKTRRRPNYVNSPPRIISTTQADGSVGTSKLGEVGREGRFETMILGREQKPIQRF